MLTPSHLPSLPKLPDAIRPWLVGPCRVTPLAQGTANQLYRLETGEQDLVWRAFSQPPAPGVDRHREQRIMSALQEHHWMPQVLVWHQQGVLMPCYSLTDAAPEALTASDRAALLQILIVLWRTPVNETPYDYPALIRSYAAQAPDIPALQQMADRLNAGCQQWPQATPRLIHSDLHPGNVWRCNGDWLLLDWEYAAPGNPWLDAVNLDRWLHWTPQEKVQLAPWLAPWAVPGDAWGHYHQWLDDLDALWAAAARNVGSTFPSQGTS